MHHKNYSSDEPLVTNSSDGSEAEHESSYHELQNKRPVSGEPSASREMSTPETQRALSVESSEEKISFEYLAFLYEEAFLNNASARIAKLYEESIYDRELHEFQSDGKRFLDYPNPPKEIARVLMLCGGLKAKEMVSQVFLDDAILNRDLVKVHLALQWDMGRSLDVLLGNKIKYPTKLSDTDEILFPKVKYDPESDETKIALKLKAFDIMHALASVSDIIKVFDLKHKSRKAKIAGFEIKGREVINDVIKVIGREFHDWLGILHLIAIDVKGHTETDVNAVKVWNIMDVINFLYVGYNRRHKDEDNLVSLESITQFLNEEHDITNRSRVKFDRVFKSRIEELYEIIFDGNREAYYQALMNKIDKGRDKFSEFMRK